MLVDELRFVMRLDDEPTATASSLLLAKIASIAAQDENVFVSSFQAKSEACRVTLRVREFVDAAKYRAALSRELKSHRISTFKFGGNKRELLLDLQKKP